MLKERIIEMLQHDNGLLDMRQFLTPIGLHYCSYDFAGLILKVSGHPLQINHANITRLPLSAPEVEKKWLDFELQVDSALESSMEIAALARQFWAAEYGDEEARALPFYERNSNIPGTTWWDELDMVGSSTLIAFLQNGVVRGLNCCWAE